jgi:predicted transposase/invertase (TIGR01784 family)
MSEAERAAYTNYMKKIYNDRDELQAAESRGLEKGKIEGKLEVALEMLLENFPDEMILKLSKLTASELAELKASRVAPSV